MPALLMRNSVRRPKQRSVRCNHVRWTVLTKLVDQHGTSHRAQQVPGRETAVESSLRTRSRDADALEHQMRIVRDQAIARPLREDGDGDDYTET
jgi:hypothetical protein